MKDIIEKFKCELLESQRENFHNLDNKIIGSIKNLENRVDELEKGIIKRTLDISQNVIKIAGIYLGFVGLAILVHAVMISFGNGNQDGIGYGWILANYALLATIGAVIIVASLIVASRAVRDR